MVPAPRLLDTDLPDRVRESRGALWFLPPPEMPYVGFSHGTAQSSGALKMGPTWLWQVGRHRQWNVPAEHPE